MKFEKRFLGCTILMILMTVFVSGCRQEVNNLEEVGEETKEEIENQVLEVMEENMDQSALATPEPEAEKETGQTVTAGSVSLPEPELYQKEDDLQHPLTDGVFIEIYKGERILRLWEDGSMIDEYLIGLGFSPVGHKQKEGDGKTPEGSYYICVKNPVSRFYLSLGVSYPNHSDAKSALALGRITQSQYDSICKSAASGGCPPWDTPLGGEIMIHGNGSETDWTAGCIAVDNEVMDILWEKCDTGTKIMIYP